ncbi:MAG: hypothetical protein ACHQYQ_08330 [Bacteriovoracales bacterium]
MKLISYFLIFFFTYVFISHAKVDAYNYNFSLDQLKPFTPGNRISDIKDLVFLTKKGEYSLSRTEIVYNRYKFFIYIQAQGEIILDFFARLPSYFLHDIFHQALINRLGKQSSYIKKETAALYIWKTNDGLTHYYQGTCTINCFPEFYSVVGKNFPPDVVPFLERMDLNLL